MTTESKPGIIPEPPQDLPIHDKAVWYDNWTEEATGQPITLEGQEMRSTDLTRIGIMPQLAGFLEHGVPQGEAMPALIDTDEIDADGNPIFIKAIEFETPQSAETPKKFKKNRVPYVITERDIDYTSNWLDLYKEHHDEICSNTYARSIPNYNPEPDDIEINLSTLKDVFASAFEEQEQQG